MPDKQFLETYSLYRKFDYSVPSTLDNVPTPAINGICEECKTPQTFRQVNKWYELESCSNFPSAGAVVRAEYLCSSCINSIWTFYLRFADDSSSITKVGQWPAWTIAIDPGLAKILGLHAGNFRKGLVCESQSYGIGAFAYYRRIVEELIGELLNEIEELIPESDRAAYANALAKAKQTIVANDKIALVKDLLPPTLRPDGMNPLSALHSILSAGLHGRSDEECLDDAEAIRQVLVFLVNQILQAKESAKSFTAGMQKILDRKGKRDA